MPAPPERRRLNPHRRRTRLLMKATANGHLLPFFRSLGNHITLPADQRWNPREIWGAAQITYRNDEAGTCYTVTHSKRRAFATSLRTFRLMWTFWWGYADLKARWQKAYPELTGDTFWAGALKLDDTPSPKTQPSQTKAAE